MPEVMGKPGKMDWSSFVARRRLVLDQWLPNKGIKNYADLIEWCAVNGIEAPSKRKTKGWWPSPGVERSQEKVSEILKPAPKKKAGKKKKFST